MKRILFEIGSDFWWNCFIPWTIGDLKYISNIKIIDLSLCDKIIDQGLKYLKGVHAINLTNCNKITDQGL